MLFNLLLLLCLYLPFQVALNPAESIDLASIRIFILILFFLWLASGLKNKRIIISANKGTGLLALFLFLNLVSLFFARNGDWSVRKLLFLFSIFPIYFIVSSIVNDHAKFIKIIKALAFSGTLAAAIGIIQFLSQFIFGLDKMVKIWGNYAELPFLGNNFGQVVLANSSWLVNIAGKTYFRAVSVFPDPHMFSFFLGLLLPLSIGLGLYLDKNRWLLASAIILAADILTFSRGAYLGLTGGGIVFFFLFWQKVKIKYRLAALSALAAVFLIVLFPGPVSSRFFSSFNLNEGSNSGRITNWQEAYGIIANHPLIGVGIGNYSLEIDPLVPYRNSIYAHNAYLDIAAETGILSSLAFVGILFAAFFGFIKKAKKNNLYFYLAASVAVFSFHSLVDTGIYSPVVLTLFLIIIGLNNVKLGNEEID